MITKGIRVGSIVLVLGIFLLTLFIYFLCRDGSTSAQPVPVETAKQVRTNQVSRTRPQPVAAPVREWIVGRWNTNSYEIGIQFAAEDDPRIRALVFEKLFSMRDSLSADELTGFKHLLEKQVRSTSDHPFVVASAIRTLAGLLDYLKTRGAASDVDLAAFGELSVQYAQRTNLDLQIRGAAIRVTGDLEIASGRSVIEALLADPANLNTPDISRNGCLALVKLAKQDAFMPVQTVFVKTSDPAVFGTAAYCLGQVDTSDAMVALVENSGRFPDSASCDAALVNMERVILEALGRPENQGILSAIRATEHLWKDGQRERYVAALRALLTNSSITVRRASCDRLIDAARRLPFAQERQELGVVLDMIRRSSDLRDQASKIQGRMGATVLSPAVDSPAVPTQRKE